MGRSPEWGAASPALPWGIQSIQCAGKNHQAKALGAFVRV